MALDEVIGLSLLHKTNELDALLDKDEEFRTNLRKALDSIDRARVEVILVGSEEAQIQVNSLEKAKWAVRWGLTDSEKRVYLVLDVAEKALKVRRAFTKLARKEMDRSSAPERRFPLRRRPVGRQSDQKLAAGGAVQSADGTSSDP
jgi:hypothetical protein